MKPPPDRTDLALQEAPDGSCARLRAAGAPSPAVLRERHELSLDGFTYESLVANQGLADLARDPLDYMAHAIDEFQPRNPAERMLAVQMIWQHARIAELIKWATREERTSVRQAIDVALDQAMNTARRQAIAWQQMTAPSSRTTHHFRGEQINISQQQVVTPLRANEQGLPPGAQPPSKRPYRLSKTGRQALVANAESTQPWLQSTGPRSTEGKARSSRNALKHGLRATRSPREAARPPADT